MLKSGSRYPEFIVLKIFQFPGATLTFDILHFKNTMAIFLKNIILRRQSMTEIPMRLIFQMIRKRYLIGQLRLAPLQQIRYRLAELLSMLFRF